MNTRGKREDEPVEGGRDADDLVPINIAEPEITRRLPLVEIIAPLRYANRFYKEDGGRNFISNEEPDLDANRTPVGEIYTMRIQIPVVGHAAVVNGNLCTCEPTYSFVTMHDLVDTNRLLPPTSLRWVGNNATTRRGVAFDCMTLSMGASAGDNDDANVEARIPANEHDGVLDSCYIPQTKGGERRALAFGTYPKIETFRTRGLMEEIVSSVLGGVVMGGGDWVLRWRGFMCNVTIECAPMRMRVMSGRFVPEGPYGLGLHPVKGDAAIVSLGETKPLVVTSYMDALLWTSTPECRITTPGKNVVVAFINRTRNTEDTVSIIKEWAESGAFA
ncbi:hypothetical protein DL768_002056 [Monosporascus sp. mg162]|nr:hypothetical protein DL768_002056 [Monosporascus sp. mg162]